MTAVRTSTRTLVALFAVLALALLAVAATGVASLTSDRAGATWHVRQAGATWHTSGATTLAGATWHVAAKAGATWH